MTSIAIKPHISFRDMVPSFLDQFQGYTRKTYAASLRDFFSYFIDLQDVPDEVQVQGYINSLKADGLASATINVRLSVIKKFYKELKRRVRIAFISKQIPADRSEIANAIIEGVLEIPGLRRKQVVTKVPATPIQVKMLLDSIDCSGEVAESDMRDRSILSLLSCCGLRRVEIIRAKRGDLKRHGSGYHLSIQQKGHQGASSFVILHGEVAVIMDEWLSVSTATSPNGPLFPNLQTGGHLSDRFVTKMVRKRLDAVGLHELSTHSLRHTFATIAFDRGSGIREVQQALGHQNITTTERYLHTTDRLAGKPELAVCEAVFNG